LDGTGGKLSEASKDPLTNLGIIFLGKMKQKAKIGNPTPFT